MNEKKSLCELVGVCISPHCFFEIGFALPLFTQPTSQAAARCGSKAMAWRSEKATPRKLPRVAFLLLLLLLRHRRVGANLCTKWPGHPTQEGHTHEKKWGEKRKTYACVHGGEETHEKYAVMVCRRGQTLGPTHPGGQGCTSPLASRFTITRRITLLHHILCRYMVCWHHQTHFMGQIRTVLSLSPFICLAGWLVGWLAGVNFYALHLLY